MTEAKVTTWWSVSGGSGKTTLACAYAAHLAKSEGVKVALLDFNEVFPCVHKIFGIDHTQLSPVYDAIEKEAPIIDAVREMMVKKQGIWILPGVSLSEFEQYKPEHFAEIIKAVKKSFSEVVIDTNSGLFFASTYASLKESGDVRLVLEPSIYCLENAVAACNFITDIWGINRGKITAALNKWDSGSNVNKEEVERVLGTKTDVIKNDKSIKAAFEKGQVKPIADTVFGCSDRDKAKRKIFSLFATRETR